MSDSLQPHESQHVNVTRYFCLQGSQYLQIPDKIFEMFLPLMQIFGKNKTKQKQIQEEEKRLKKKKKASFW